MDWPRSRQGTLRPFYLLRDEDVGEVSGTGIVAIGVVFPSGRAVMEWCSRMKTLTVFPTAETIERIHGHKGRTRLVFGKLPSPTGAARRASLRSLLGGLRGPQRPQKTAPGWTEATVSRRGTWWLPVPPDASRRETRVELPPPREWRRGAMFPGGIADRADG